MNLKEYLKSQGAEYPDNLLDLLQELDTEEIKQVYREEPEMVLEIIKYLPLYVSIEYKGANTKYRHKGYDQKVVQQVHFSIGYPDKKWKSNQCQNDNGGNYWRVTYKIECPDLHNTIIKCLTQQSYNPRMNITFRPTWNQDIHKLVLIKIYFHGDRYAIGKTIDQNLDPETKISWTEFEDPIYNYRYYTNYSNPNLCYTETVSFSIGIYFTPTNPSEEGVPYKHSYHYKRKIMLKGGAYYPDDPSRDKWSTLFK
jgi:hypothetical protein